MGWRNANTGWLGSRQGWGLVPAATGPLLFTYDFVANPSLPGTLSVSRTTSGTYIDSSGVRNTASANVARFDCDWDGSAFTQRGIRVEGASSNIIGASENPTSQFPNVNGSWSTSSTPGADNSTNMHLFTVLASTSSNTSFSLPTTCDFFVVDFKKDNWNYVLIDHVQTGGQSSTAVFDLVNGTVSETFSQGSLTLVGAFIRRLRNGIYRCGIKTSGSLGFMILALAPTATGNTYDNIGQTTYTSWAGTERVLAMSIQVHGATLSPSYLDSHIISNSGGGTSRGADLVVASGSLATQLAAGPSVWEMEDLTSGTISRTQFAAGAFNSPVDKRYRSFGVYTAGTDTSPYLTVGGAYI